MWLDKHVITIYANIFNVLVVEGSGPTTSSENDPTAGLPAEPEVFDPGSSYAFAPPDYSSLPKDPPKYSDIFGSDGTATNPSLNIQEDGLQEVEVITSEVSADPSGSTIGPGVGVTCRRDVIVTSSDSQPSQLQLGQDQENQGERRQEQRQPQQEVQGDELERDDSSLSPMQGQAIVNNSEGECEMNENICQPPSTDTNVSLSSDCVQSSCDE